jgi:hypothetical protein
MWITPPSIQSAFAQASRCSTKDFTPDLNTWASEAERSCSLSGKLSPSASWRRAWKKDHWLQRLSGLAISPNSRQDDFAAWWMASLRGSPAKTCPSPAVAPASMASDPAFSSTYSTSQTIAVRGSSFWRTSQASLLPPPPLWTKKKASLKNVLPPESWENWPTVGGMRSGSLFLRPMWVPVMGEQGGSASRGAWERWDTPDSMPDMPNSGSNRKSQPAGLGNQARAVMGWPTPDCNTATYSNGERGQNIREAASQWMTPNVPNGGRSVSAELVASKGTTPDGQKRTVGLESQIRYWPTPQSHDSVGGKTPEQIATMRSKGHGVANLNEAAPNWPTPAARDFRSEQGGVKTMDHFNRPAGPSLPAFIAHSPYSPLAQATQPGQESSPDSPGSLQPSQTKRLNPYFVEWLMGWPAGWTSPIVRPACAAEEMVLYHFRRQLQSQLSLLVPGLGSKNE